MNDDTARDLGMLLAVLVGALVFALCLASGC